MQLLLAGAPAIGANGLLRFYLLHVLFMPLLGILFLSVHYYKVAREHSISLPAVVEEGEMDEDRRRWAKERIDIIPDLLTHEVFLIVATMAYMTIYVTFFYNAALESHADAFVTPLDTKAPWYFLWIQGMLKLGDPTLMGVIVPTIMIGLLIVVPYIDRNPSRLGKNRKLAITLGVIFVLINVILSYMGTPQWGIETPPAPRILQDLSPQEGEGPVEDLGYAGFFEELEGEKLKEYNTEEWTMPENPTEFERVFATFQERVGAADARSDEFNNVVGVWEVEQWQPNMIRIAMSISWDDDTQESGRNAYSKDVYLHEESNYGGH